MNSMRWLQALGGCGLLAGLGAAIYLTQDRWRPWLTAPAPTGTAVVAVDPPNGRILLTDAAIANLKLTAKLATPGTFWKTMAFPGSIVDRPGFSDRGVVAPTVGVIASIDRIPGHSVHGGDPLFTLKILSDTIHQTQTDLFKAVQDIALARTQRKRLQESGGVVPEARLVEIDQQIARLESAVSAFGQALTARGFSKAQIDEVALGKFATELRIVAPPIPVGEAWEIHDLKVGLGQQVNAGETLCMLANHRSLTIEGRAFRDELPRIEASIAAGWPLEVDFQEDSTAMWPPMTTAFHVHHLASAMDPASRTFDFCMNVENQSKEIPHDGHAITLWRFRPGQRVRILVRTEKVGDVIVLPATAVVRDGAESYAFTQNVNTFERVPVRIVAQDREQVAVARESLPAGAFVVQNNAAWLLRLSRTHSTSVPAGYHMHADGSLHKNGEPE